MNGSRRGRGEKGLRGRLRRVGVVGFVRELLVWIFAALAARVIGDQFLS